MQAYMYCILWCWFRKNHDLKHFFNLYSFTYFYKNVGMVQAKRKPTLIQIRTGYSRSSWATFLIQRSIQRAGLQGGENEISSPLESFGIARHELLFPEPECIIRSSKVVVFGHICLLFLPCIRPGLQQQLQLLSYVRQQSVEAEDLFSLLYVNSNRLLSSMIYSSL